VFSVYTTVAVIAVIFMTRLSSLGDFGSRYQFLCNK
jgi:hypothetical protein